MEILATLHPDNNPNDDLFPNIKKENIPSKAINLSKLSLEVQAKLPKVINTDEVLPATKLKYLEIDGVTYSIPQRVDITSNIKITSNKSDILSSPKNLLCILNNTSSLAIKVVDKIEGGSEEISALSEVLPQKLFRHCGASYGDNIYIFGGSSSDKIYKFNTKTEKVATLNSTLPKVLYDAFCCTYADSIYIFGGIVGTLNTIYKFNCITEEIVTLETTLPKKLSSACCATYGDNIYIFGGYNGNNDEKIIYKFNCIDETITSISTRLPQALEGACCSIYRDNIYIFGGYGGSTGNRDYLKTIYKFNCVDETIETLGITLPKKLSFACCSIFGDNIYIFGGQGTAYSNTIYKFNCTTNTIEALSTTLPQPLYYTCCSIYESNIYLFGGYNGSNNLNTIYNFSIIFELTTNNVLIYNANSNYSFDLITDQVTIPIKNVYIGDSNNTAQLANAYLYDETQTAWVNVNTGEVLTL